MRIAALIQRLLAEELQNSHDDGFLHIQDIIWCNEKR